MADAASSRTARRFVDAWLQERELGHLGERATLAVSELAANANLHTNLPFTVRLFEVDGRVRVEVVDSAPELEPMRVPTSGSAVDITQLSETGRGLLIVSSLANRWGITLDPNVKTVWCEFEADEPKESSDPVVVDNRPPPDRAGLRSLVFHGLPVREAIGSGSDVQDAIRDLQVQAGGSDADAKELLGLIDATAPLRLAGRHAAMRAAAENQLTFDLELWATEDALRDLGALNRALARRPAPRGRAVVPEEVQRFRNWLSEETQRQAQGTAPRRYPRHDESMVNRDWLWDHAPCGYVRADPDGRITHVNATLRDWLGLDPVADQAEFPDLLDEASRRVLLETIRPELRAEGRIERAPFTLRRVDGSPLQAVVTAVFEHDVDGKPSGIRGVIDLADRPTHEEELQLAEQRAGRSESRALELLQALQRTLIPAAPTTVASLDVSTAYEPAVGEVGGDFFDIFEVTPDDWCVVVGDVSGKGIEAAIVTAEARHAVRSSALREPTPSGLLGALNRALIKHGNTRFCTVALARLQLVGGTCVVTLSTGGHPYPLLLRHGAVTQLGKPGSLIGVFEDVHFEDVSIRLTSGDALIFYTDGIPEARDANGEFFGDDRMTAAITSAPPTAEGITAAVVGAVSAFRAEGAADDVALVVIRRP